MVRSRFGPPNPWSLSRRCVLSLLVLCAGGCGTAEEVAPPSALAGKWIHRENGLIIRMTLQGTPADLLGIGTCFGACEPAMTIAGNESKLRWMRIEGRDLPTFEDWDVVASGDAGQVFSIVLFKSKDVPDSARFDFGRDRD